MILLFNRFSHCVQRLSTVVLALLLLMVVFITLPEAQAQQNLAVLFAYDASGLRIIRVVRPDQDDVLRSQKLDQAIQNEASRQLAITGLPSVLWYDENGDLLHSESIFDPRLTRVPENKDVANVTEQIVYRENGVFMLYGPPAAESVVVSLYENRALPSVKEPRARSFTNDDTVELAEASGKQSSSAESSAQVWTFSLLP